MHKALLALTVVAALSLAGCGAKEKGDEAMPVECPDGSVVDPAVVEAMEGHHDATFNATESLCPVKPSVKLEGLPASLQAFRTAPFRWTVDNGSVPEGHSMLTSIRYSDASVPDAQLTAVSKYPSELIKREHQGLPVAYEGNLTFAKVATVYLRAYAQVQGAGVAAADYWSPEVKLEVTPVVPTGKVVEFKIPAFTGAVTPAEQVLVLGDAIKVTNEDPVPGGHACSRKSGPAETQAVGDAEGAEESIVMVVPGTYEYECDTGPNGLQPSTFKVIVNA